MIVRDRMGAGDASVRDKTIVRQSSVQSGVGETVVRREIAIPRIKLGLSGGRPGFFYVLRVPNTPLACDMHLLNSRQAIARGGRHPKLSKE